MASNWLTTSSCCTLNPRKNRRKTALCANGSARGPASYGAINASTALIINPVHATKWHQSLERLRSSGQLPAFLTLHPRLLLATMFVRLPLLFRSANDDDQMTPLAASV